MGSVQTIERYGMGTVETRPGLVQGTETSAEATGLDYLGYWTEPYFHALGAAGLCDETQLGLLHKQGRLMHDLTETVVREGVTDTSEVMDRLHPTVRDIPLADRERLSTFG